MLNRRIERALCSEIIAFYDDKIAAANTRSSQRISLPCYSFIHAVDVAHI